jgi:hypothetical protein
MWKGKGQVADMVHDTELHVDGQIVTSASPTYNIPASAKILFYSS